MRWIIGFLAALLVASLPASAQAPRRVALVIGNATYVNAGRLANPASDARLVAASLARAGFQTVDARNDLGVRAFGQALREFRAKANGAQVALVYYAGHGIEGNGKNWLIPTDAALSTEYDLSFEAISLDQVMEALAGANLRVVILDACRDNPLGRSWNRGTRAVSRGLAPVEADDVLVIYAAAPGQTAADGQGAANSPFAAALARRIPQPGLAIQLLGGQVRDDVLRATGSTQRPFVSASITGEPFYLVHSGATAPPPQSVGPSQEAIELATWQGALQANTADAYSEYLRQFPNGRFKALAQQNIARLRPVVSPPAATKSAPVTTTSPPSVSATTTTSTLTTATFQGEWRVLEGCTGNSKMRIQFSGGRVYVTSQYRPGDNFTNVTNPEGSLYRIERDRMAWGSAMSNFFVVSGNTLVWQPSNWCTMAR